MVKNKSNDKSCCEYKLLRLFLRNSFLQRINTVQEIKASCIAVDSGTETCVLLCLGVLIRHSYPLPTKYTTWRLVGIVVTGISP